jgi:Bacteriophage related domain of unknown function
MITDHIEQCLRNWFLLTLPDAVGKTAFENQAFDPGALSMWYAFHYMPNMADVETLGVSGYDVITGIAQIDVHVKAGTGKSTVGADFALLRDAFTPRQRLVYQTADVIIERRGRVPGAPTRAGWHTYSFSIQWRAYTANAVPPAECPEPEEAFDIATASPVAWWRGDAGITRQTATNRLTNWADQSGNGWNLNQAGFGDELPFLVGNSILFNATGENNGATRATWTNVIAPYTITFKAAFLHNETDPTWQVVAASNNPFASFFVAVIGTKLVINNVVTALDVPIRGTLTTISITVQADGNASVIIDDAAAVVVAAANETIEQFNLGNFAGVDFGAFSLSEMVILYNASAETISNVHAAVMARTL